MNASRQPATIVVCAMLPDPTARRFPPQGVDRHRGVPVTWIAPAQRLVAGGPDPCPRHVAVELDAEALASRGRLRAMLAMGREAAPSLEAVVIRGPVPAGCRSLLVDEGIRVVLVDSLGDRSRSARRPAPAGWRCRNVAWGLWEVERGLAAVGRPWSWLGLGPFGRLRPGGLHVIEETAGSEAFGQSRRLERILGWMDRHVARGARAVSLAELGGILGAAPGQPLAGSVLHAA